MKALLTKLGRLFSKSKITATNANEDRRGSLQADSFGIYNKNSYLRGVWVDLSLRQKHIKVEKADEPAGQTGRPFANSLKGYAAWPKDQINQCDRNPNTVKRQGV